MRNLPGPRKGEAVPAVAAAVWWEREGAFHPEVWLPAGVVTRDRPITIFFIFAVGGSSRDCSDIRSQSMPEFS